MAECLLIVANPCRRRLLPLSSSSPSAAAASCGCKRTRIRGRIRRRAFMNQLLIWFSVKPVRLRSASFSSSVGYGCWQCSTSHCFKIAVTVLGRLPRRLLWFFSGLVFATVAAAAADEDVEEEEEEEDGCNLCFCAGGDDGLEDPKQDDDEEVVEDDVDMRGDDDDSLCWCIAVAVITWGGWCRSCLRVVCEM